MLGPGTYRTFGLQRTQLPQVLGLSLPDPEDACPTCGTHPLGCWPAVLHRYVLGILHFSRGFAFYAVSLHRHLLILKDLIPKLLLLSLPGAEAPKQSLMGKTVKQRRFPSRSLS